jgi:hypothetical protein
MAQGVARRFQTSPTAMGRTPQPSGFSGAMRVEMLGEVQEAAAKEMIHQLEDGGGGSWRGAGGRAAILISPPSKAWPASHGRLSKTSWKAVSVTPWSCRCFGLHPPCWDCFAQFIGVGALWCLLAMPALLCLGGGPLMLSCRCNA